MNFILPLISGTLIALSFPKPGLSYLAWVAFVPLFFVCLRTNKMVTRFGAGLITGLTAYSIIFYWIVITVKTAGEPVMTGVGCLVLLAGYLSLYMAVFCLFLTPGHDGYFKYLFLSAGWVLSEYIRTYLFSGFPWALAGYSQWNWLKIIQVSDMTGVYGVSFVVILSNIVLSYLIRQKQQVILKIVPLLIVLFACLGYGTVALIKKYDAGGSVELKVTVLQGNIDQYKKWDENFRQEIIGIYSMLNKSIIGSGTNLVVWPETALPGYLLTDDDIAGWVKKTVNLTSAVHLIGSMDYKAGKFYNSCFMVKPGSVIDTDKVPYYAKVHLVPFGEYIPFQDKLRKYIKVLNDLGDTDAGIDYKVFSFNVTDREPINLSVNICFESIFPGLVRKFTKSGAEFIVNITNDAWYLDTSAPYQHFMVNVFRAVENRKQVVRSANTGISGLIDEKGRVVVQTKIFDRTSRTFIVKPNKTATFYSKHGDMFVLVCLLYCLGWLLYKKTDNPE
jgi:apolipoprotein N-acyltransferase